MEIRKMQRVKMTIISTSSEMTLRDVAQLQRNGYDVLMHGNIIVARDEYE